MDTNDTETSLLTSEVSLTRIHGESDLLFAHTSRHTSSGFLVEGPLLKGYIPTPPTKYEKRKWYWKEGEAITRKSDGKCFHLCQHCWNKNPRIRELTPAHGTQILRHMDTHGYNKDGTTRAHVQKKRRTEGDDVVARLQAQDDAQRTTFVRSDWKLAFLRWAVGDEVSLSKTASQRFRDLIVYRNPIIEPVLPRSHNTTRRWIISAFPQAKGAVRRSLSTAKSRVSISFDAWKSDNELDLLGVIAHYIDADYTIKNVLLALRNTYGCHTGDELAHHLLNVIRDYRISTKLAYFIADNASSNDTALHILQTDLTVTPKKQRIRCVCHVINLVTKSILYGTDIDCINDVLRHAEHSDDTDLYDDQVSKFEEALRSTDEVVRLKAWRKKGPVGKLHNIIIHARDGPARRQFFMSKQKEALGDAERLYQLVINGGIRWNSTCDMIKRALKLKDAIDLYTMHFRDDAKSPLIDDELTSDDWHELTAIYSLLAPLKETSLFLQSSGKDCRHGNLFESLQAIDFLLSKLEALKKEHQYLPNSHFKASINLGWKKLNKYYTLSDDTAAYRAAIALHPSFKMQWFEEHWGDEHPNWIPEAKVKIKELFQEYKRRHSDEVAATAIDEITGKELSEFERYNRLKSSAFDGDELERYLREERAPQDDNPLDWWRYNQHRYPVLRHMAFDLLATPASSSADERIFSQAGHVLDEERFNTKDDLAEAQQCLKSIFDEGIDVILGR